MLEFAQVESHAEAPAAAAVAHPAARPARGPRTGRRMAVAISIGLHALALGAASLFLAGAEPSAPEREPAGTVRLDLRRAPPVPERADVAVEIRRAIPDEIAPASDAIPPEPLDRELWAEVEVVAEAEPGEPLASARGDGGFPGMASAEQVVRVPRRATGAGVGAAGVAVGPGTGSGPGTGGTGTAASGEGTGGGAPAAVPPPPPDTRAVAIDTPRPAYPDESRRRREEGIVGCVLRVRADGTVESVEVRASSGSARLDRAAVDALERWRFTPATHRGAAVASLVDQDVRFHLRR